MRAGHVWLLVGGLIAVPLFLIAVLIFALQHVADDERSAAALIRAAWSDFLGEPGSGLMLWALAILVPVVVILMVGQRTARIRMTSTGLAGRIPRWLGLGLFRQTAGTWELLWDDIRRVRLVPPAGRLRGAKRLGWYRLVVETGTGEVWLNPFAWFDRAGVDHRLRLGELLKPGAVDADRRVHESPLVMTMTAQGIDIEAAETGWKIAGAQYNLARHRGMLGLLAVFMVAGVYTVVDTFFLTSYRALEPLPLQPFIAAAMVMVLLAWLLGRGAPTLERLVVGALAVIAVVAAVHPGTLRFNAATARPETVPYRAVAAGVFESADRRRPPVDLADIRVEEYWAAHPPGAIHEFTLLRGDGGFYQLDLAPLYVRTRVFYERRRASQ